MPEVAPIFDDFARHYGFSWITMTFLAMLASFCLPRQFQVMVVENVDERHLDRALWQFPLYLLAINLFVLPIAHRRPHAAAGQQQSRQPGARAAARNGSRSWR